MVPSVLIVASKDISLPLASVSFSVMSASTFRSDSAVLSRCRTASLNVIVILLLTSTPWLPSDGETITVGLRISAIVNVVLEAVLGLSYKSSTVAPMAAYTTWPELKSFVDAIVMTVLPPDPGPSLVHSAPEIVPWLLLPLLSLSIVPVPSLKSQ